jgi:hypothetical protein
VNMDFAYKYWQKYELNIPGKIMVASVPRSGKEE